ncbi:MAG TPA: ribbon-helix-helix protein, CopG family [Acidimicrobiia bacterium]
MIRTQISLSEEQMERLRRLARHRRTSIAALLREAVDARFSDVPSHERERALRVVGAFASGAHDTSEHHDEALADAFGG